MEIVETITSDGLKLFGAYSKASQSSKRIIIHIHGRAGNFYKNSFYKQMQDEYTDAGWAFLATQNRGSGTIMHFPTDDGSKIIGNAYEVFEDSKHDIESWVQFAQSLGYEEIWLQGHSLGPSKIAYYISQKQSRQIKGLILISPSDEHGLVHEPIGLRDHEVLLPESERLIKAGKRNQLLSRKLWGTYLISAGHYHNFFKDDSNTAIFNYFDRALGWEVVNSIDIPLLAITGTKDDGITFVIEPTKAMEILKEELKGSPFVETVVLPNAEHSFNGFEEEISKKVLSFIDRATTHTS